MVSSCPNCLNMVSHQEGEFEIQCECGTKFNPFLPVDESGGGDVAADPAINFESPPQEEAPINFGESDAAFGEIRDFAEGLVPGQPAPDEPSPDSAAEDAGAKPTQIGVPVRQTIVAVPTDFIVTSSGHLDGYTIETYLTPVSMWIELDGSGPNPLKSAIENLAKAAAQVGGNGAIDFHWSLASENKCLVSATPVKIAKS